MTKEEKEILCEPLVKLGVFMWIKKYSWDYKELKQMMNDTQQKAVSKMKKKALDERHVRVDLSLAPKTLERLDKNVERIAQWMLQKGADEKQVRKIVTRSALIKEMVERLDTEAVYHRFQSEMSPK